ncbi:MAG TPA: adenylate/guanylate cyclase domain-containing protein [Actinomycetota bacterium]|nr:adenylate/guanylate cyclase domain-containing protein [Actinomycetota bacterium]
MTGRHHDRATVRTTPDEPVTGELDRVRLRFRHPDFERAFREHFGRHNVTNVRVGHALAIVMWVLWGAVVREYLNDADRSIDLLIRYGLMIPLTSAGFALTFWGRYPRIWQWPVMGLLLFTGLTWIGYIAELRSMPADYGYVGLILIQTFAFSILRLPFALVALFDLLTTPLYFGLALWTGQLQGIRTLLAVFYLASFLLLGLIAAYVLEWKIRRLFMRERQLASERQRSDSLLENILPVDVIERLKARHASGQDGHLAETFGDVTVLFADAVGFTVQAAKTSADELVDALDDFFWHCDALTDRYGLEKIKTVGDAYMAVAGVPRPRPDHAAAAAGMALAIVDELRDARWPSGDPFVVRVGIASGPAVAGVIGQRKFAYDLWGDTVNLASRLESHGSPGRILASESVVAHLEGAFEFGPPEWVDLKGKGPTPARFLLGPRRTAGDGSKAAAAGVSPCGGASDRDPAPDASQAPTP